MANMACKAAVLMYMLQHDMLFDVLLIAFATGACMARCGAGCVPVWKWIRDRGRHRWTIEVSRAGILTEMLQDDMLIVNLTPECWLQVMRARRGAGRVQVQVVPGCIWLADVATQQRKQP